MRAKTTLSHRSNDNPKDGYLGQPLDFYNNKIRSSTLRTTRDEYEAIEKQRKEWEMHEDVEIEAFYDQVTIDFETLKNVLTGKTKIGPTRRTNNKGAVGCEKWLLELMSDNKPKEASKTEYRERALKEFHVSARQFNFAWSNAIAETGNTEWSKPGRVQS